MTNREWLNTLSNKEFAEWLYSDYRVMTTTNKNYETTWVKPPKSYSPTLKEILYCWHIPPKQRLAEWLEEKREDYEKEFIISTTTTSM